VSSFGDYLLGLYGDDPFASVRAASEAHRAEHAPSLAGGEQQCGVYPSDPLKLHAVSAILRAAGSKRILEIGCGLGYSALWLAFAAGESGHVQTIDRFPEHALAARRFAQNYGLAARVDVLDGDGASALESLSGPYDAVHDDGWFAAQPPYYDRLADLLRPGGLLIMSNWFLLEHAVSGGSPLDWAQFAGKSWADDVKAYADRLATDERWDISFFQSPAFALAVRRA
jgi:predicted O-methyltransferase YrrM